MFLLGFLFHGSLSVVEKAREMHQRILTLTTLLQKGGLVLNLDQDLIKLP